MKVILLYSLMILPLASRAAGVTADEIMKKNFTASKFADSTSDSTFRLINEGGQERVRETKSESKMIPGTLDNQRLVTFLSPSDVKGTKTLLVEHSGKNDDIWIYLPALKKVRRLVANNKKDAFVGTDFSYGDVIGYQVQDWNHKLQKEDKVDGRDCYLIESTPKTAEIADSTGYSKRVNCIDKESFVAISAEGYDQSGALLKKMVAKNLEKLDAKNGKWAPLYIESKNVQTNHKTVIELKNYKVNVGVKDEVFTARNLEK